MEIGVRGKISWGSHTSNFHFTTAQYKQLTAFPASEGPRSVIEAASNDNKESHRTVYHETDAYATNLCLDKYGEDSDQRHLLHLTHALTAARKESDVILTHILNGSVPPVRPSKRVLVSAEDSDDEADAIKRQRHEDAQEIEAEEEEIALEKEIMM